MPEVISTVSVAFRELLSRIELNPARVSLATQRYNAIGDTIKTALPGKEVRQIGSFQRKTKIRPIKDTDPIDVDAIVCFGDARQYATDGSGVTPQNALEIVRRAIISNDTYRVMNPASDAPTVALEYYDGFKIELVPCFREITGRYPRANGPACYIIGSPRDRWIPADYDFDAAIISASNQHPSIQETLVPSIKMIKAFIRNKDIPLKSFHTEILCARIIPNALGDWQSKNLNWNYQHVLSYFLSNAHSFLHDGISLPGSFSPPTDSNLSLITLQQIGKTLSDWGSLAWKICEVKDESKAIELWRDFYEEPFPI